MLLFMNGFNMKKPSSFSLLLIILFMTLLVLPSFFFFTGIVKNTRNFENRPMAKMPPSPVIIHGDGYATYKEISGFSAGFENFINDQMPVRNLLFRLFRDIKVCLFNTSPLPERVVIGKNGWFFLGNANSDAIREAKGLVRFTDYELSRCVDNLKNVKTSLKNKGIRFYFTIAPGKATVYGKYLPIISSKGPTKAQQLKEALKQTEVPFIEIHEDTRQFAGSGIYYKSDSHWNQAGAFLAYRSIIEYIRKDFPDVSILSINDFDIDSVLVKNRDLVKILQMEVPEFTYNFRPGFNVTAVKQMKKRYHVPEEYLFVTKNYETRFINKKEKYKVLVFGDSFMFDLFPFLVHSFGESICIRGRIDKGIIDNEQPDIVIFETVERDLDELLTMSLKK